MSALLLENEVKIFVGYVYDFVRDRAVICSVSTGGRTTLSKLSVVVCACRLVVDGKFIDITVIMFVNLLMFNTCTPILTLLNNTL